jgi:hypothetical protein
LTRQDIAAALHLAVANAALALEYLESGDAFAAQYLTRRIQLYANFAAECALELREAAT